jgi:hypothetical protein
MGIGPPCDVAGSKDARDAGLEICVHGHAPVGLQAGTLGELDSRPYADANNDEVPDLTQLLSQYSLIEPWLQTTTPEPEKERLQSPEDRGKVDGFPGPCRAHATTPPGP